MLRVIVCVALLTSGCAFDPPPVTIVQTKTITKVVKEPVIQIEKVRVACPTDDHIKDIAIAASRETYFKAPKISGSRSGSGDCPCRHDTFMQEGEVRLCGENSAEARGDWVMCHREKVPPDLVEKLKAKMPECQAR